MLLLPVVFVCAAAVGAQEGPRPTVTSVTITPSPSVAGQPVVITATVTALNSSARPDGGVEFYAGFTRLGMAPLLGEGDTRTAAMEMANLAVGRHELTARFLGHPEFQPSASLPAGHVVNPAAAADDRQAQR